MRRMAHLLLVLLAALPAGAAHASRTQTTSFEAPRDLLDPDHREAAFDEIGGMGVRALRIVLYWHDVAPAADAARMPDFNDTDSGAYDWSRYDPTIREAHARGWTVLLTVSGPVPRWATLPRRDTTTHPSPQRFARFMQAVAQHYRDDVGLWSIWNEPNHPDFLGPQYFRGKPASGQWYRKLFLAGYRGLRRGGIAHPKVLMGETAPVGTRNAVAPLTFLRQALCLNARYHRVPNSGCRRLPAAGYAHHAYTRRQGPFYVPAGRNDVTIGSLSRLTRALDRAGRAGAIRRRLPVYLTEFGIQSVPDPLYGVSQRRQAEYRAISERIAWGNPRVKWFSQYLLRDDTHLRKGPRYARYPGFESGLRFANGRAKLSLRAFPLPLAALRRGGRVTLWGQARPAHRRTRVAIYVGRKRYRTIRTDARGYFTRTVPYVRGRSYRLRWAGRVAPAMRVYPQP
jgi:hypothetical protein